MKIFTGLLVFCTMLCANFTKAQQAKNIDTLKKEIELKHYMPLYLDVPAELNVRKGFKEVNIGGGYADFKNFSGERALIEYDFAPIDKLGIEIEVPSVFVHNKHTLPDTETHEGAIPEEGGGAESGMGLRVGFSYSFLSLAKAKTTFGAGYFNELETSPFKDFGKPVFTANIYNPFIVVAKIWGERWHSMIYTGPAIKQEFESNGTKTQYRFNTIISYRFGTGEKESFAGIECNQAFNNGNAPQLLLRPQVQVQLTEKWKIGIVAGIPVMTANELNGSGFFRLIYSPSAKK